MSSSAPALRLCNQRWYSERERPNFETIHSSVTLLLSIVCSIHSKILNFTRGSKRHRLVGVASQELALEHKKADGKLTLVLLEHGAGLLSDFERRVTEARRFLGLGQREGDSPETSENALQVSCSSKGGRAGGSCWPRACR